MNQYLICNRTNMIHSKILYLFGFSECGTIGNFSFSKTVLIIYFKYFIKKIILLGV